VLHPPIIVGVMAYGANRRFATCPLCGQPRMVCKCGAELRDSAREWSKPTSKPKPKQPHAGPRPSQSGAFDRRAEAVRKESAARKAAFAAKQKAARESQEAREKRAREAAPRRELTEAELLGPATEYQLDFLRERNVVAYPPQLDFLTRAEARAIIDEYLFAPYR